MNDSNFGGLSSGEVEKWEVKMILLGSSIFGDQGRGWNYIFKCYICTSTYICEAICETMSKFTRQNCEKKGMNQKNHKLWKIDFPSQQVYYQVPVFVYNHPAGKSGKLNNFIEPLEYYFLDWRKD